MTDEKPIAQGRSRWLMLPDVSDAAAPPSLADLEQGTDFTHCLQGPPAGVTAAAARLEDARDALQAAVDEAREAGASWAQIGEALGVRRQTAWQRFGGGAS